MAAARRAAARARRRPERPPGALQPDVQPRRQPPRAAPRARPRAARRPRSGPVARASRPRRSTRCSRARSQWAHGHGFTDRLALLAAHGLIPESAARQTPAVTPAPTRRHPPGRDARRRPGRGGRRSRRRRLRDGRTALHQAAFMDDVELVTALLDAGADPTRRRRDPRHPTAQLGGVGAGRRAARGRAARTPPDGIRRGPATRASVRP